ncbi:hypothetical protein [Candidatus Poriferisodalis sp.]|uniref:hypothetical protein n=1 Tax=Candidatus Poriferisodalis sp. TaxID=3101277 RepID=UPI003B0206F1
MSGAIAERIKMWSFFVFITSFIVWKVMDLTVGLRVSTTVEQLGQDTGELGIEAYPEFVLMPENFDE